MMPLTKIPKSLTVAPPAAAIRSRKGVPTGAQNDFGLSHRAADREKRFGDRLILRGLVYVVERLDVAHYAAHLQRNSSGGNQASGGRIDQLVFVA